MPYTISYDTELRILEVKIQGNYQLAEAKQLLAETTKAVKEHGCFLILADVREINLEISILELYKAPQHFENAFSASEISVHQIRRAVVIRKEMTDPRFLENVVVNRGQIMKLFYDIDKAKEWLQQGNIQT